MSLGRRAALLNALFFKQYAPIAVGCSIMGVAVVKAPAVAWGFFGIFIGLLLLEVPAYIWVSAAFLAATLSRLLVATEFVHPILNFFHFPLAVGAALVAALKGTPRYSVERPLAMGCVAFLFLSLLSWAFNGGELIRPLLNWLVFLEPFLIIYALVRMPPPLGGHKFLWKLALAVACAQFPLAMWQAFTLGLADYVQGTFIGMGAGAHVAGGVALVGTLVYTARGMSPTAFNRRLIWLLSGILLFTVPVIGDAKQAIIAFLPGLFLLMSAFLRFHWTTLIIVLPILSSTVLGAFLYYPPLQMAADWERLSQGLLGKLEAFAIITMKISDNPPSWLFGLGPGNSISRVALMGLESYLKSDSPISMLGLRAAPATREISELTLSNWLLSSSSVWSGISSWLGLFGDLGVAGLALYLWMSWTLWQNLKGRRKWEVGVAKAVLVMTGLLGAMYSWLEEPGFMLLVALIVGLGLIASGEQDVSAQNHARTQFISTGWR